MPDCSFVVAWQGVRDSWCARLTDRLPNSDPVVVATLQEQRTRLVVKIEHDISGKSSFPQVLNNPVAICNLDRASTTRLLTLVWAVVAVAVAVTRPKETLGLLPRRLVARLDHMKGKRGSQLHEWERYSHRHYIEERTLCAPITAKPGTVSSKTA